MFTDTTMDATRRMLLENNRIKDGDVEYPPMDEELDTLMKESTIGTIGPDSVPRRPTPRAKSLGLFLNIPSNLPTRRRRRGCTWFLNSTAYHPRLLFILLGKG